MSPDRELEALARAAAALGCAAQQLRWVAGHEDPNVLASLPAALAKLSDATGALTEAQNAVAEALHTMATQLAHAR